MGIFSDGASTPFVAASMNYIYCNQGMVCHWRKVLVYFLKALYFNSIGIILTYRYSILGIHYTVL
jgi:hypothetical protein